MNDFSSNALIDFYNTFLSVIRNVISDNFGIIAKSSSTLLATLATMWIIYHAINCWRNGGRFLTDAMFKLLLFVVLGFLLSYKWFDTYILSNLQALFDGLPSLFSRGSSNDSVIGNLISQNYQLSNLIMTQASNDGWFDIGNIVFASLAILVLISFSMLAIILILIASIEFYLILSLSPLWILAYFLQPTRKYTAGAFVVLIGSIVNVTLLGAFLNLFGGIINQSLSLGNEAGGQTAYMQVIVFGGLGAILLYRVSALSQTIAGHSLGTSGSIARGLVGRVFGGFGGSK